MSTFIDLNTKYFFQTTNNNIFMDKHRSKCTKAKNLVKKVKCASNLNQFMMSTFAEGDFWSKKSTIPSVMGVHWLTYTLSDFKLHKEGSSAFNKLGTKEITQEIKAN